MGRTSDLDHERRLYRLLLAALERPPEERHGHVVSAAGEDPALAAEVLSMLADQGGLGGFLERPAVVDLRYLDTGGSDDGDGDGEDAGLPAAPGRLGPYAIVERLGAGGMGEVFRARQEKPVRREVAVKLLRTHLPPGARQRFLVEQDALARLSHSNVARFYDAGTTADGRPYFAMELVAGQAITDYCDARELTVAERLRIFLDVCAGVEHAHRHQLLHRDLKPSNVLVVEESGRPVPKVIDFGIAKSLDARGSGLTLETGGSLLGTPAYMSPEALAPQGGGGTGRDNTGMDDAAALETAALETGGLDTRADVYSLGVLLFELLTGRTPFDEGEPGLMALLGRVEVGAGETLSQCLRRLDEAESGAIAARRGTTRHELRRTLGGDLDWIVAKAIAAERERRYGSVGELAADVERFLADRPVEARPPSAGYRLRKLARRHRAAAVASAVALAGLLLGVLGLGAGLLRARQEAVEARQAQAESEEVSSFLVGLFDASRPGSKPPDEISAKDLLARGVEDLSTRFADQPAARGRFLRTVGDVYVQMGRYDEAAPMLDEAERLLRSSLPADDPDVARMVRSRGVLAYHRGRWKQAEALLRAGLVGLGPADDPEAWALAVHNLGVVLLAEGRLDEAEAELRRALEARVRYLPPDHPHLARSYNALGTVALQEGDADQAVAWFSRAAALLRRSLGPHHVYVAMALENLARAYGHLHRWADGESALTEALAIREQALGPDHPDVAVTLVDLAQARRSLGEEAQAEADLKRALEVRRAAFGGDDPRVFDTVRRLGAVEYDLGHLDEAESLLRESLAAAERAGKSESSLEFQRMYLGLIALERGHLDGAESVLGHSLAVWERDLGRDNPSLSWPLLGLARIRRARGDLAAAEPLARRAVEIREEGYPAGNHWLREARALHAEIARELGLGGSRREGGGSR